MKEEISFKTVVIDGGIFVFATTKQGIMVGIAEASKLDEKSSSYYFNRLFIKDDFRGNGYSKILLQKFTEEVDKQKIDIDLAINPYGPLTFEKLKELYESYGFKEVGENHFLRTHN